MKNILLICLFSVSLCFVQAQNELDKMPNPGPAPEVNIPTPETFTLENGLKVFVVENNKLPRVAFQLLFDRDPVLEGEAAGYVSMAGQLVGTGTESRTKDQIDEEVDFLGADLYTSSTGVYAASLSRYTEKLVELMADVVLNATFTQEEFDKIKKQTISGLAAEKENPDAIAANISNLVNFGPDHPYGEFETPTSVENISLDQCQEYYNTYFKPNIGYLAIVGDITAEEAERLIRQYFGEWEQSDVAEMDYEKPEKPSDTRIALVDRSNAVQSVINVTYPVNLKPGSSDDITASVMNSILGGSFSGRINQNLREDKGYTYGARSYLNPDREIGEFGVSTSVRNEVTDSTLQEIMYELNRIVEQPVLAEELELIKGYMSGSFARSLEDPETVADFAINTERYGLPADYYQNYLKNIDAVRVEDIQEVAQQYITPDKANIVVVGKGSAIADKISSFGEITYYRPTGEMYEPAKMETPTDITAEQVIANYIEAVGGEEALNNIEDMTMEMSFSQQGMEIAITSQKKNPGKSKTEVVAMGQTFSKTVFDGQKGKQSGMQGESMLEGSALEDARLSAYPVQEMGLAKEGYEIELIGVEEVDGKKAYVIEWVSPLGSVSSHYYDADTGLKLQSVSTTQTPQGEMSQTIKIDGYQEVNGMKFPQALSTQMGPQNVEMSVDSIEINTGLADEEFVVE